MNTRFQQQDLILRERISASLIRFMIPFLSVLLFINAIISFIPELHPTRFLISGLSMTGIVPVYILQRKNRNYTACRLIIILWTLFLILAVYINGGIDAPGYIALLVPLSMIVWISSPRTTIIYSAGYILLGFTAVLLDQQGLLPQRQEIPQFVRMIHYSTYVTAITGSFVLGYAMLHKTLRENIEKQNLLDSTFASVDDSILILDSQYRILHENGSAAALRDSLLGGQKDMTILDLKFESKETESTSLRDLIKEHNNRISQMKLRTSGTLYRPWLFITVTPRQTESEISGMVLVIRDVTEQVEQEYHLRMTQKMDAVGQLASGIAHDFNNMLGSILGAAELLGLRAREDQKEMLSLIFKATDKATKLTRELLLFTRKAPKQSSSINIHEIIEEVSFLLSRTLNKNITIERELKAENYHVIGDNTQIQSALMNMAINASHAMPEGGTLSLSTRITILEEDYCTQSSFTITPGQYIVIEVSDTGTGIPKEVMLHIFEPFFTTKEVGKGTGLGLSAVYGMVQKHKGAIDVRSQLEKGTVFEILLPLDLSESESIEHNTHRKAPQFGTGRVLIVDDEQFIRITSAEMLGALGYTVFTMGNGEEALAFLEKEDVDLVILDMIMPARNGRETFYEMQKRGYTMPVILSSGFSEEADTSSLKEKGLFGFIRKPFQRIELSQIVSRAMAQSRVKQ